MIDIIFYMLVFAALARGWRSGLIGAVFSFMGCMAGLAAAIKLSTVVARHLENTVNASARWLPIFSFVLVFMLVIFIVRWLAKLIETAVDFALLGWFNKLAGIVLYMILYTAVYSILLFYGTRADIISAKAVDVSLIYPHIKSVGPGLINFIGRFLPYFRDMFATLESFFQSLSERIR